MKQQKFDDNRPRSAEDEKAIWRNWRRCGVKLQRLLSLFQDDDTVTIEEEVEWKVERLRLPKGKSVKTVLVYQGELDATLEEDGYFDYLVPVEKLLGRGA